MDIFHLFGILIILATAWFSLFFRWSSYIWTAVIGILLISLFIIDALSLAQFIILGIFYLAAAIFVNLSFLRQHYLLSALLNQLKAKIPVISNTEREALEAGQTWWEKELLCGKPHWQSLLEMPKPKLTEEEQRFLSHQVETVCAMINDWEVINQDKDLPAAVWDYLKAEKFFGMVIPKQYGGLGFSALAHSTVVMKIASRSISAAVNTMVPNSLGPAELLIHYGTPEQKNHYLPKLAKGEELPCFALTAPDAGSDAGSIPDSGIVCYNELDGEQVLGIRLNWDKRYITLAPIATVLGMAFRLYDPEKLMGTKVDIGITLCLIPTKHPGVEIGNRHYPLQLAFMNGPTRGQDVFIPLDWIIGGPKMAGQGWAMLMECLSIGRSISLPALAAACSKMSYRYTGAYARVRRQFNSAIASFEGIEEALGHIAGYTYLIEATRLMTLSAVDQQIKPSVASAIAKYHMTELCRKAVSHAMDVHAGHMIQVGPRNFLAYMYIAMPISITVEGANILTRNLIIFGQGATRCHPYLLKEVELLSAPTIDIKQLDKVLMSHVGFFLSNIVRNISYGLTGGRLIKATLKNPRLKKYEKQLTRMSAALSLFADMSMMLLGGSLKRRERLSARLGDIMSHLYLASATLKYFYDHEQPHSDEAYVMWSLEYCLYQIELALNEFTKNFPYPILAGLFKKLIFMWGSAYSYPKDHLHKKIVAPMISPSDFRNRLTTHCYVGKQVEELPSRLDKALADIPAIEVLWKKIQKAIKQGIIPEHFSWAKRLEIAKSQNILSHQEVKDLEEFEKLRQEIIKVNEFNFDLNEVIA